LVGSTTPTASSAAGVSGASVASGTGVAVGPQADTTIAATNKIAIKTYSELFLNIISSLTWFTWVFNRPCFPQCILALSFNFLEVTPFQHNQRIDSVLHDPHSMETTTRLGISNG
jgi:hypothetical protein